MPTKRISKAVTAFTANLSTMSDDKIERLYNSLSELCLWEQVAAEGKGTEREQAYAVEFATDYRETVIEILTGLLPPRAP